MEKNILNKIASASLVIGPFLSPYFLPGTTTTLDTVFIFIISIYLFLFNGKLRLPKKFICFFIYALFIPLIGNIVFGGTNQLMSSYIVIALIYLPFTQIFPFLDYDLVKRYYSIGVWIASLFFIIQTLSFMILGWRPSGLLPFLPVSYDYTTMSDFIQLQMYAPRSQSLFLEPSHFVQYILGYLCIVLSDNINHKQIFNFETFALIIILVLTWSGTAIVLLGVLLCFYIMYIRVKTSTKIMIVFPLSILLAITSFYVITSTNKGTELLERSSELSTNADRVSSGTIRIYRGYFVYGDMNPGLKIIGVGPGYCPDVINNSSYTWMFREFERYLNTSQTLLVGYGLIGTVLFIIFLFSLRIKNNYIGHFIIIYFIGLSIMESFWGTSKMLLYIGVAISAKRGLFNRQVILNKP